MITVADVMKLPSMYGTTILAGHAGLSNPVESVTVLEYGQITNTLDELFSKTEFQGNDLIITSFATIADDVDAQCENIRRYHAIGCVGFILFYIGLILPSVDDRVIACCNELDLVLITMPRDIRTHKYSDVIGDIYHAIFKDQQAGSNYVSTLIRRFSNLPAEQRNTGTLLRMLSNHLQASIILTDYKKSISNIVCWPQSLSELLSKDLKKQLQKMQGEQAVKISYDDGAGYLQHCPTLLEGKEGFDLYTFKYNELLSREDLWQASEFVQLYSHIWNKDLGKLVTSELVRAIIDDDPLKMRRLADLFQINVAELNQMWVFDSVDSSEPDLKLLRKCTEYFSGIYKTVLVGYYESNMVIFAHAPQTAGERDAIVQDFINESADSYSNYVVVCCDCLNTTNDAHNAYFDVMQYASFARSIYPQKRVLRPSDVSFASICAKEAACREAQIHYLKIIEDIEATPELLTTLTAYLLDHESSMANTAKALCCHINTIKYRLNAIRDNTGYSPSKPADVYPLLIAVAINRMRNSENE